MIKITWLGQAGLLIDINGTKIIVDPYLSNSIQKVNPQKKRNMEIDESYLKIVPDILVCTHNHLDHVDPETLKHYLENEESITVLAPQSAWEETRKFGGNHNYIRFNRHTEVSLGDIKFSSVKAEHSDIHPIGVIIEAEGKKLYITGDTLYNTEIFSDIPENIDAVFLPINGEGNNMNMADALRFCQKINPKIAVPVHWGLFDDINPNEFPYERKFVPQVYKEFEI